MQLNEVSNLALMALQKSITEELKNRKENLTVGSHNLNESIQFCVTGTVNKGEDITYIPTVSIPHKAAMALLVHHCGIVGEAAVQALQSAITEALEANEKAESYVQAMKMLTKAEEKVKNALEALPKATKSGITKYHVEVK